jgi:hypothetical protein
MITDKYKERLVIFLTVSNLIVYIIRKIVFLLELKLNAH